MERDIQRKTGFSLKLRYNLPNSSEWVIYEIAADCNFDLCKFPEEDEEILPPAELLADCFKKRKALDHEIDKTLAETQRILGINVNVDEL